MQTTPHLMVDQQDTAVSSLAKFLDVYFTQNNGCGPVNYI